MTEVDTKQAILDAGEELLGQHGFAGTSLRQLTTRAGVNLAAVHYHFGNKEGLAQAVLARRIEPINAERLRRLDAVTAGLGYRRPDLRAVVDAFVSPVLELLPDDADHGRMCRMFGRIMAEQPPFLVAFLRQQFGAIAERFVRALGAAQPGLDGEEAMWRLHFAIGALAHTLQHADTLRDFSGGRCDARDMQATRNRLVDFIAGGMRGLQVAADRVRRES